MITGTVPDAAGTAAGDWPVQLAARLERSYRVVFAEGDDPRVRGAAARLVGYGITPVLICEAPPMNEHAAALAGVEVALVGPLAGGSAGDCVEEQGRLRNWSPELNSTRRGDPIYLAGALVRMGRADAAVGGSRHPTRNVIRAGLHMIGLAGESALLSSSFLLRTGQGQTMCFGDCAVVAEPDAEQLAQIAIASAGTFCSLTGTEAKVAMLSFSTRGSADHESVRRVRAATELVRRRAPMLSVDGELQFDAALVPSVGAQKAADSAVAGHANVFIFPNLAAGNIGYKIAQRLGRLDAFGPILQGLRAPYNDLSRGCSDADIVAVAMISALQAQSGRATVGPGSTHESMPQREPA